MNHRTKIAQAQLESDIRAIVTTQGFEVKQLAGDLGLSACYVHGILRRMGYRSMLVREDERLRIIASRQARKPLVKSA